jgi:uncharacterized protein (DUF488 family)
MGLSGEMQEGRAAKARALVAFGVAATNAGTTVRTIREGGKTAIYTVGYERRDGEELINLLREHGITALADIRERPVSRKPDFRASALRALCMEAGIEYQSWAMLGSTVEQRDELHNSGDFKAFERTFRVYAKKTMKPDLERLAESVTNRVTALLCYERCHEDCHRSVIAELVADKINANIFAL